MFIKRLIIYINTLLKSILKSSSVVIIAAVIAGWANWVERCNSAGSEGSGAVSKGSRAVSEGSRAVNKGFKTVGKGYRGRYFG